MIRLIREKIGDWRNTNVTQSEYKYTKFLVVCQGGKAKIIFQLAIPGQKPQRFFFRGQINKVFLYNLSEHMAVFDVLFFEFFCKRKTFEKRTCLEETMVNSQRF